MLTKDLEKYLAVADEPKNWALRGAIVINFPNVCCIFFIEVILVKCLSFKIIDYLMRLLITCLD